jgi:hypothetical protein
MKTFLINPITYVPYRLNQLIAIKEDIGHFVKKGNIGQIVGITKTDVILIFHSTTKFTFTHENFFKYFE